MNTPTSFKLPEMKFDIENYKTLKEAYEKGELAIQRESTYRGLLPKPGHIFFWLLYNVTVDGPDGNPQVNNRYAGAYEMLIDFEQELEKKGKLITYLIFQLTLKMTL